jgi:hypothetical protein
VVLPEAGRHRQEGVGTDLGKRKLADKPEGQTLKVGKRNREVKNGGSEAGVEIACCLLPKKSPWLNAMKPKWIDGRRKVVESHGLLEIEERSALLRGHGFEVRADLPNGILMARRYATWHMVLSRSGTIL